MDLLRRWTSVLLSLASVGVLAACNSASPTTPTEISVVPASSPSPATQSQLGALDTGTVVTFVSAETGAPAVRVDVVVNGVPHVTDEAGEIHLSENVTLPASIEAASADYLLRETVLHAREALRLSLWPRRSPTGLDENLTRVLIYTDAAGGAQGALPMRRLNPSGGRVSIVPSPALMQDAQALAAHVEAAEALTRANGGAITFVVEASPTAATVVQTVVDGNDPAMRTHAALAYRYLTGAHITGARIVFVSREVARMSAVVTHELGHTFGLEHSSHPGDLMFPVVGGPKGLSTREVLAMELMLQRRPGNRFPDNDRDGNVTKMGRRTEVVACGS